MLYRIAAVFVFFLVNALISILPFVTEIDFPAILLYIFIANFFFYFLFYITEKLRAGETLSNSCLLFLVLSITFMLLAFIFFRIQVKNTSVGAAESMAMNRDCILMDYFDVHDIWHFLSSFGLFFKLCFLLTLDDDVAYTHQNEIAVF